MLKKRKNKNIQSLLNITDNGDIPGTEWGDKVKLNSFQ